MTIETQPLLWTVAGTGAALAVVAGWREARRKRRRDPDAVGMFDWPTVQLAALVAAGIALYLSFKLGD